MTRGALVLALVGAAALAPAADLDPARAAWRHRRSVTVTAGDGFAALPVPPEVEAAARPDLRDLRLLAADGTEVPYVVDHVLDREAERSWTGRLVDQGEQAVGPAEEDRGSSTWTVDLDASRTFDTVALDVDGQDFAKHLHVDASADGQAWHTLVEDAPVFDRAWHGRVRHTWIALPQATTARYLRLSTSDQRRSPPIAVTGVTASWTRRSPGESWSRPVLLAPVDGGAVSRFRLELPPAFPIESLTVGAEDAAFTRRVVLREVHGHGDAATERVLADGTVYRVRLPEEELAGERLTLPLSAAPGDGQLLLDVYDGDSPPLRRLLVTVSGVATRLLFPASGAPVVLYYGNDVTRAPLYDLGPLQGRIASSRSLLPAHLGAEEPNEAYRKPAPLAVTALRGAPLDASRWRASRTLTVTGGEDLRVATLAAEDLARLRSDLGDLRIADGQGRQVPYILEPAAVEARVPLTITRADERNEPRVTRYRLALVAPHGALAVPLSGVVLTFSDGFFDRPARVLAPAEGGDRRPVVLFTGRLDRRPTAQEAPPPLRIDWPSRRASALELVVDDGDNAPLTLAQAEAAVRVPRVTFQAGAGPYRLLLGNADAPPPQYDLASLRGEVLAYSAVPIEPAPAEPNPAFRRFAGDYFRQAPPTLLLWGALLAAVGVLLWLTLRVLKHPSPPGPASPDGAA